MNLPPLGFIPDPVNLALDRILPSRRPPEGVLASRKFNQIVASLNAVGLIEPLSVTKSDKTTGLHLLLDGHMRWLALKQIGFADAPCLIATDDESYTYNNRINRLSSIQEHFMLRRAIERGVSPERLAKALSVDVSHIMKKMNLLEGICAEAAALLEDRQFSAEMARVIRKMKPTRQIECVELDLKHGQTDADLLVLDVQSHAVPPPIVDVWVVPICDRTSNENAADVSDRLRGHLIWLGNMGREVVVPAALAEQVELALPMPYSRALAQAADGQAILWNVPELSESAGARSLRASLLDVLRRAYRAVGQAVPPGLDPASSKAPSHDIATGDVGKGDLDLVFTLHFRARTTEAHRATFSTALHLAHKVDPYADQQQHWPPAD